MNWFCYISDSCCSCYIYRRTTSYQALITTAIDVADDTDRIWYEISLISLSCPPTFCHVDVHLGITIHVRLKATSIYIINTGSRLHIHRNLTRCSDFCTISFRSRIWSLISTTKEILDSNRHTVICFLNVNGNITTDTTCTVVTTINIFELTCSDSQFYIMLNVCIIGTAINIFDFSIVPS